MPLPMPPPTICWALAQSQLKVSTSIKLAVASHVTKSPFQVKMQNDPFAVSNLGSDSSELIKSLPVRRLRRVNSVCQLKSSGFNWY